MFSANQKPFVYEGPTPYSLGYHFPAEWSVHKATWLSWIHKEASWPGKLETAYAPYTEFIKHISLVEKVCINVGSEEMEQNAHFRCKMAGANMDNVSFYQHPTNDAWCRDHGPAFLINEKAEQRKIIVDWAYNAWGGKYPPFDLDDVVPTRIAEKLGLPVFYPGIIMEGGSVDFNGAGSLLTTKACLLNRNRNPQLTQDDIEWYLKHFYGVEQILWLEDGIEGDDTDGHIDDLTRFVNADTVVTVIESNRLDNNYDILQKNLRDLESMRLLNGQKINIMQLPMPKPVVYDGQRLPASYANFYIANDLVVVPVFKDKADDKALRILEECFPGRSIVGIDSTDLIWGLGAFHCLSQQEPV